MLHIPTLQTNLSSVGATCDKYNGTDGLPHLGMLFSERKACTLDLAALQDAIDSGALPPSAMRQVGRRHPKETHGLYIADPDAYSYGVHPKADADIGAAVTAAEADSGAAAMAPESGAAAPPAPVPPATYAAALANDPTAVIGLDEYADLIGLEVFDDICWDLCPHA